MVIYVNCILKTEGLISKRSKLIHHEKFALNILDVIILKEKWQILLSLCFIMNFFPATQAKGAVSLRLKSHDISTVLFKVKLMSRWPCQRTMLASGLCGYPQKIV